ncbi:MAG: hypothetical protein IMZ55_17540, partial [Acidobacteria bacterium]|nr:hypothetical protein [Acidobacteriota bacterium]
MVNANPSFTPPSWDLPGAKPPAPAGDPVPLKALPPLASPPRDVPLLVWMTNLLGGFYNQFGWMWVGFTGVFLWVFVPFADVAVLYYFRGDLETASGRVVASRETNCSVNDVKVQAQDYRFVASDGAERQGTSFATGRRLNPGEAVTVEYVAGRPEISRIRGMRRGEFGVEGWGGLI